MVPDDTTSDENAYMMPPKNKAIVTPISSSNNNSDPPNAAANLIRSKVEALFKNEPSFQAEMSGTSTPQASLHLSKHQKFIHQLTNSGHSLAEIQTAWHQYYTDLADSEKHEVWQEFYAAHAAKQKATMINPTDTNMLANLAQTSQTAQEVPQVRGAAETIAAIRKRLLGTISERANLHLKGKPRLQSLVFGIGMGGLVVLLLMFSFFNERFIAPFITPSRHVSSSSIIIDPSNTAADPADIQVIIPKINVEAPVVYDEPSIEEKAVQVALERGVVHYGVTPNPGEVGNAVIFGHSSNNILNKGKYKFAFALLNKVEKGDTFILTKGGKRYVYQVYDKRIVKPTDVSVLNSTDKRATATLITCDPPGSNANRLIVVGEQITPDPAANVASSTTQTAAQNPVILPSNSPSLWQRIKGWFTG